MLLSAKNNSKVQPNNFDKILTRNRRTPILISHSFFLGFSNKFKEIIEAITVKDDVVTLIT